MHYEENVKMRSLDELLNESTAIHGHHCSGQVLGVRMAMLGCREVGIDEPKGCKKLVVYVEIDRCATDAVQAVTGCSLGKRTLKFLDYGKMAATFVNTATGKAVRVLAKDDARGLAPRYAPDARTVREAQKEAYRVMPEDSLFSWNPATLKIAPEEMPGYRGDRVQCDACGEGINFHREVAHNGRRLCIPCSQSEMVSSGAAIEKRPTPKVLLVVGYKKVGKTTLIEKLIPELSSRGYRVGTVKHHHSDYPAGVDIEGTDTWRHRQAGASSVALATPTEFALFRNSDSSSSLDQLISALGPADIVLVEGFHDVARAKIEVISPSIKDPRCKADDLLLAFVTPNRSETTVPSFAPDIIKSLADRIEKQLLKN
jgi:formylmethanofuran dehydrogenase subunit E